VVTAVWVLVGSFVLVAPGSPGKPGPAWRVFVGSPPAAVELGVAVLDVVAVRMGVDEGPVIGMNPPTEAAVYVSVGWEVYVGVKKSRANASTVRTRAVEVEVGVCLGWRTISSCRSRSAPPAMMTGRLKPAMQATRNARRIVKFLAFMPL